MSLHAAANALDFMEEHLNEPVTIGNVANAVGYSPYHFCRVFNKAVHHTPYNYLVRRRLSESALALLKTDTRIIDIALDHQFGTPEAYARAFRRLFGMQPSQWREAGYSDPLKLMPRLTLPHLEHLAQGDYLRPNLVNAGGSQLTGLMTLVRDRTKEIPLLWEVLESALHEAGCDGVTQRYGISWYPRSYPDRGFTYVAAAQLSDADQKPAWLVEWAWPAGTYARFIHKGTNAEKHLTRDYIYHTWLAKSEYQSSLRVEVELVDAALRGKQDKDCEIPILIPLHSAPT